MESSASRSVGHKCVTVHVSPYPAPRPDCAAALLLALSVSCTSTRLGAWSPGKSNGEFPSETWMAKTPPPPTECVFFQKARDEPRPEINDLCRYFDCPTVPDTLVSAFVADEERCCFACGLDRSSPQALEAETQKLLDDFKEASFVYSVSSTRVCCVLPCDHDHCTASQAIEAPGPRMAYSDGLARAVLCKAGSCLMSPAMSFTLGFKVLFIKMPGIVCEGEQLRHMLFGST